MRHTTPIFPKPKLGCSISFAFDMFATSDFFFYSRGWRIDIMHMTLHTKNPITQDLNQPISAQKIISPGAASSQSAWRRRSLPALFGQSVNLSTETLSLIPSAIQLTGCQDRILLRWNVKSGFGRVLWCLDFCASAAGRDSGGPVISRGTRGCQSSGQLQQIRTSQIIFRVKGRKPARPVWCHKLKRSDRAKTGGFRTYASFNS